MSHLRCQLRSSQLKTLAIFPGLFNWSIIDISMRFSGNASQNTNKNTKYGFNHDLVHVDHATYERQGCHDEAFNKKIRWESLHLLFSCQ